MESNFLWLRTIGFALFGVWFFSYMLWDFILAMIKTYEKLLNGEANAFDFKVEVQCFVVICFFAGWGLYTLYKWFEALGLGTWLAAGGAVLIAVWFNRLLEKKWRLREWRLLDRNTSRST